MMQPHGASVAECRSHYASYVVTAARQSHLPPGCSFLTRLEGAFDAVPRELFLPPGPWHVEAWPGHYIETPSDDVRHVYQDVLVAIDRSRGINNGQPSGHARFMSAVAPQPGETVVHIGAGLGYYSAILSVLVSPGGRVEAFEIDAKLAAAARRKLRALDNVSVTAGDATALAVPAADVVYVNAGVLCPPSHWLAALRPGGRMFVPWQPDADIGVALIIRRVPSGYEAKAAMPARFIPCAGTFGTSRDDKPLDGAAVWATRSLHLTAERAPDATATAVYRAMWFSSAPLPPTAADTRP